jgi:F1F0 ATPase subunit 2
MSDLRGIADIGPWLIAGALAGSAYFLTLRWNVDLLVRGGPVLLALALQMLRFAAIAALLAVVASRFGAAALLAAALGLVAARWALVGGGARA